MRAVTDARSTILSVALAFPLLTACGEGLDVESTHNESDLAEAWNPANNPGNIGGNQAWVFRLGDLPLQRTLNKKPWSDTYWPNRYGGIAQRWRTGQTGSFSYSTYTRQQLQTLSSDQIGKLSPAEKFDILRRQYNYPTVSLERSRTSPNDASWEGLCHGWAPASLAFSEPKAVTVSNPDGITIPFGSSDIKALLTQFTGYFSATGPKAVGVRCMSDITGSSSPECRDTNAGAFHVVLANKLGLGGEGIVADVTATTQIWNQPVYSYLSSISGYRTPSSGAAPGTVREAIVRTTIWYTTEVSPQWNPLGAAQTPSQSKTYDYRLELGANDQILGGSWISSSWPDLIWVQPHVDFSPGYRALKTLYETSIQ